MSMSFETREANENMVAYLKGRIDVHMASEIEASLQKIIRENPGHNIVLNLKDVEYMSSSGLRVLVSLMRMLRENNRALKLTNLSVAVKKVFEVVELMDMFEIYDTEEAALKS